MPEQMALGLDLPEPADPTTGTLATVQAVRQDDDGPIVTVSAGETGRVEELARAVDEVYRANGFAHSTFADTVDLWLYTLLRYQPGAEDKYMETVRRMQPEAVRLAPKGFAILLTHFCLEGCYADLLGPVYQDLASRWKRSGLGQYFTPWPVALMMAQMVTHDVTPDTAEAWPPTVNEPAVGSGVMLLAARAAFAKRYGRAFASRVRMTGQDLDPLCVAMARVQLTLTDDWFMSNWLLASYGDRLARGMEASDGQG